MIRDRVVRAVVNAVYRCASPGYRRQLTFAYQLGMATWRHPDLAQKVLERVEEERRSAT